MLKKNKELYRTLLFISDLLAIVSAWMAAYYLRFSSGLIPVYYPAASQGHIWFILLPVVAVIWGIIFRAFGLYGPRKIGSYIPEVRDIIKASSLALLLLVAVTFFLRRYALSRLAIAIFGGISVVFLAVERVSFREMLKSLRRKGYNIKNAVIVGTGPAAGELFERLEMHPDTGIKVLGFVACDSRTVGTTIKGAEVIGVYEDIRGIITGKGIDEVIMALGLEEHNRVADVLKSIGDEAVDIKVVPDIYELITLRGGVEDLDGIPIVSLRGTPLYGWNFVLKRVFDAVFAAAGMVITSPLMFVIAVIIKLTSPGPVFFRQERMSIGGDTFELLKFRSMRVNAEKDTGPVWAASGDPRRTPFGAFLRKTSLDELPQLLNVLKGEMSLVGPRPERPVFIKDFRKTIPRYMLRHKMKAGITGWAQVSGLRGNTDLRKRIEHDLYYIENWSLSLDLKIILLTVWRGFVNTHAY
ncbi:MAG: undecaprenyl-phosphate glucose phosphotransferase [Deltaproteobacteria bacterium]|nr:undecaprenyl-phosphate glucose phosphotransferase [Deltaproteobacteria bacterium]